MAPMDLQDRAQYLSLALFSQKVVSALMDYVDEDRADKLRPSLEEALDSLLQAKRSTVPAQRTVAAFSSYEHIRTIEEVWNTRDRERAIRMARSILAAPRRARSKEVANQLIELFSELQNQALWNFQQPKPVSPRIMRRLCQPA